MTPEERRALEEAGNIEELEALLEEYWQADKLTEEEAVALWDEIAPKFGEAVEPTPPTISIPPTPPSLVDQFLNDPQIMADLGAYTSKNDLADRISNLLRQGALPDETTGGALYNRILGRTASRQNLDIAEANLATYPNSPTFQQALAKAQKAYEVAQTALDQSAGMSIRASGARTALTTGKVAAERAAERAALEQAEEARARQAAETQVELINQTRQRARALQAREVARPPLPGYRDIARDVAEELLGTISAPRFREFVRSKLGGIAAETAAKTARERAEWWERKYPIEPIEEPPETPPTFESLLGIARADIREKTDILRELQGKAPPLPLVTPTQQEFFSRELPFATKQKGLAETKLTDLLALWQTGYFNQPRAVPQAPRVPPPPVGEDPFLTEIKKRYGDKLGFMAEWLEKSPQERGFQKQRFAPRVSFRF